MKRQNKRFVSNIRPTQPSPAETSDGTNSEMILTNEVNTQSAHTESLSINEDYLKSISELTASTEPASSWASAATTESPSFEYKVASTDILTATATAHANSGSTPPKTITVISV